ncbi:hypothetical protein FNYG_08693 [Fusarium nygamai]|uniref:Uncharacterized protein n=1 Tax=Gibberella nygamai TaxID=42673 RepID=A0A2K0W6S3_GIBNY|nr:hypothetical protein FNYG_08693 [Fusarium nygamai]
MISALPFCILHSPFSVLQTSDFRLQTSLFTTHRHQYINSTFFSIITIITITTIIIIMPIRFRDVRFLGGRRPPGCRRLFAMSWENLDESPEDAESAAAETEGNQEPQGSDREKQHVKPSEEAQAQSFPNDPRKIKACAVLTRCRCMTPEAEPRPSPYYLIRFHLALNCSGVDLFAAIPTLPDAASVEEHWQTPPRAQRVLRSFIDNPSYGSKYFYCYRAVVGGRVLGDRAARNW